MAEGTCIKQEHQTTSTAPSDQCKAQAVIGTFNLPTLAAGGAAGCGGWALLATPSPSPRGVGRESVCWTCHILLSFSLRHEPVDVAYFTIASGGGGQIEYRHQPLHRLDSRSLLPKTRFMNLAVMAVGRQAVGFTRFRHPLPNHDPRHRFATGGYTFPAVAPTTHHVPRSYGGRVNTTTLRPTTIWYAEVA